MSFSAFRMNVINFVLTFYKNRANSKKMDTTIDKISFKRILVINNKLLGDFLFCTPAIRALKEKYPDAKILVVLSPKNKGIVECNPFIDEVVYMDNSVSGVFRALHMAKRFKPEISVIFHSRTPYDIALSVFSGCPYIIKHYFNNDIKKLFEVCDDYILDVNKPPVINHLALVKKLGCDIAGKKMFFPAEVKERDSDNVNVRVGYQLGASKSNRYLPVETLRDLTVQIKKQFPSCEFHLFGAPSEVELGEAFLSITEPTLHSDVVNHIGKTTLNKLADVVNNVDVLVTPDTGTLHVATALGVRTVSLFVCRKENGCEPQQDAHLHTIIYASDYNQLAFDRTQPKPLEYISCEAVFNQVLNAIYQRQSQKVK